MNSSTEALGSARLARPRSAAGGWSSRTAFVLAAAGSAVGLGNVWKFPYIAGENGGGAFVLVYLVCVAAIGLPILIAEILIGRRGGSSPVHAFESLARREGHSRNWRYIGWLGVICAFLILSFYSVVAGWSLSYLSFTLDGHFTAAAAAGVSDHMERLFAELLASPTRLIAGHTIVMVLTTLIVARGVRSGLERAVKWMVPGLFLLLINLVVYAAVTTGQFGAAAAFLLRPDFGALSWEAVLVALGHAFFTLSVGMTAMMAYGSFLDRDVSVPRASVAIAGLDTLVALLAGLAIFPIVFAHGMEPGAGPGLIFVSLPIAFTELPGGSLVAVFFFLFLAIAALSSTISILEPVVEYLERRLRWTRRRAAVAVGLAIWILGLGPALSFNLGADLTVFGKNLFDLFDFLTSNVMLPLGGMLIALYAGYALSSESLKHEMGPVPATVFHLWRILLRYVAPAGVAVVLVYNLG